MTKYLLLALLIAWLIYASPWSRSRTTGSPASRKSPQPAQPPQQMVACAHCGVHLPSGDALLGPPSAKGPQYFCNADHRHAGPRAL
jgi:uncharacterized protein